VLLMRRILGTRLLSGFLLTPAAIIAGEHHDQRYYDSSEHRYRTWKDQERRAYRHSVEDVEHRRYRDWARASNRERRNYWRWRHKHADRDAHR
jgi:hypothetical protein